MLRSTINSRTRAKAFALIFAGITALVLPLLLHYENLRIKVVEARETAHTTTSVMSARLTLSHGAMTIKSADIRSRYKNFHRPAAAIFTQCKGLWRAEGALQKNSTPHAHRGPASHSASWGTTPALASAPARGLQGGPMVGGGGGGLKQP